MKLFVFPIRTEITSNGSLILIISYNLFTFSSYQGQKGTPKNLCDRDFAELLGELSGVICLKPLFSSAVPSNCSENPLVLFVRFFGFGVLFLALDLTLYR